MRNIFLGAVFAWAAATSVLDAAVVRVFPRLGGVFNEDFTPVDPAMILATGPEHLQLASRSEKYVVRMDFLMTISDLQPPQQVGFGNAAFDIELSSQLAENVDQPGWILDDSTLDVNGGLPGGLREKWWGSCDCGGNPNDLVQIVIGTAPRDIDTLLDPRATLGIAPYHNGPESIHFDGEFAGSVFVDVEGLSPFGIVSVTNVAGSTFDSDRNLSVDNVSGLGGQFTIGVPEPPGALLLILGAICIAVSFARVQ